MKSIFTILTLFICLTAASQAVWENHRSAIYPYLSRMAQKGHIELNDIILPIQRSKIAEHLDSLQTKNLTKIEKEELKFYLQEFNSSKESLTRESTIKSTFFNRDEFNRFRILGVNSRDFKLYIDPIIGAQKNNGTPSEFRDLSNGVNLWGSTGRVGFQLYYRDYGLTGSGLNKLNSENNQTAIIELFNVDPSKLNHNEVKGHISYAWKKGSLSVGKDHLLWGYGESGKIILSDRAPSYPYIRLDYQPLKWLYFNYTHAWLNSNIVDSARSYGTGTSGVVGDIRIRYVPKFMATHSISFLPFKGITLSLGESIVYSDKPDIGFLIPIMFFKPYDNNRSNYRINAGSNAQFFFQASARNLIKNTHLYSNVFIDEIRISKVFNRDKSRNQLGFLLGASVTDLFLPYLTFTAEYTRANPFVYANLLPAQTYSQYNFSLGDWMGNNFDRIAISAKYSPLPKLRLEILWQNIRKGGAGTLTQQYEAQTQPQFLFDYQKSRNDIMIKANYEWLNNLFLFAQILQTRNTPVNRPIEENKRFSLGISYGL